MPERIAIIGISGSGKTTLARRVAERLGLPLKHGDALEWLPDWHERPREELAALHAQWLNEPQWVIEGWVDADRAERLRRAELVIDLAYSPPLCAWRALRRMLAGRRRPEMPDGNVDRFNLRFLWVVFFGLERPSIEAALEIAKPANCLRFTSPRQTEAWLATLYRR